MLVLLAVLRVHHVALARTLIQAEYVHHVPLENTLLLLRLLAVLRVRHVPLARTLVLLVKQHVRHVSLARTLLILGLLAVLNVYHVPQDPNVQILLLSHLYSASQELTLPQAQQHVQTVTPARPLLLVLLAVLRVQTVPLAITVRMVPTVSHAPLTRPLIV